MKNNTICFTLHKNKIHLLLVLNDKYSLLKIIRDGVSTVSLKYFGVYPIHITYAHDFITGLVNSIIVYFDCEIPEHLHNVVKKEIKQLIKFQDIEYNILITTD
jgi:hypothetical protein